MTQEQIQQVLKYVEETCEKDFRCPTCNNTDWGFTGSIFQLPAFNSPSTPYKELDNSCFPVIPLVCSKCGNVQLISAVQCGVVPAEEDIKNDK